MATKRFNFKIERKDTPTADPRSTSIDSPAKPSPDWTKQKTLIQERSRTIAALVPEEKDFSWTFEYPHDSYNQIGALPIYVGRGPLECSFKLDAKLGTAQKLENARNAFEFIKKTLQPIGANYVVSVGLPPKSYADHFGTSYCWNTHKNIRWTAFETQDKQFAELKKIAAKYDSEYTPSIFGHKPLTPIQLLLKTINGTASLETLADNACFAILQAQHAKDSAFNPKLRLTFL